MLRTAIKIGVIAVANALVLVAIDATSDLFAPSRQNLNFGITIFYLWSFLSVHGLLALVLYHHVRPGFAFGLSAALLVAISSYLYPGTDLNHYFPMIVWSAVLLLLLHIFHLRIRGNRQTHR